MNNDIIFLIQNKYKDYFVSNVVFSPKVSIIVPVYNSEKYLEECLSSLIKQTLKEIEIIVVDDGSTDFSFQISKAFSLDKRVKIITQSNQKQGAARNNGIRIANGEYICFVDSDDFIENDFCEKLYNKAIETNADVVCTNILKHRKKYNKYNIQYKKENVAISIQEKIKLCSDKKKRFFYVMNKIYRNSLIKDNNIYFDEGCYIEDVMFSTQIIFNAKKIVSCKSTIYHYIQHDTSTINSKNNIEKKKEDHISAYIKLHKFFRDKNIKLPERLNYYKRFWLNPFIKVYEGTFKKKYLLFGFLPIFISKTV